MAPPVPGQPVAPVCTTLGATWCKTTLLLAVREREREGNAVRVSRGADAPSPPPGGGIITGLLQGWRPGWVQRQRDGWTDTPHLCTPPKDFFETGRGGSGDPHFGGQVSGQ